MRFKCYEIMCRVYVLYMHIFACGSVCVYYVKGFGAKLTRSKLSSTTNFP